MVDRRYHLWSHTDGRSVHASLRECGFESQFFLGIIHVAMGHLLSSFGIKQEGPPNANYATGGGSSFRLQTGYVCWQWPTRFARVCWPTHRRRYWLLVGASARAPIPQGD